VKWSWNCCGVTRTVGRRGSTRSERSGLGVPGADAGLELFLEASSNPAKAFGRRLGDTLLDAPCADVSAWNSYRSGRLGNAGMKPTFSGYSLSENFSLTVLILCNCPSSRGANLSHSSSDITCLEMGVTFRFEVWKLGGALDCRAT
jgi:hypothetical protein